MKLRNATLLVLGAMLSSIPLAAQVDPSFEWAKLIANQPIFEIVPQSAKVFIDSAVDQSGNTIVAYLGSDSVQHSGASNYLAKMDIQGNLTWSNRFLPHVFSVAADATGSIYAVGTRIRFGIYGYGTQFTPLVPANYFSRFGIMAEGSGSAYVTKITPSGSFEWVRWIGNSDRIAATSIALDRLGNYLVAGYYTGGSATLGNKLLPATDPVEAYNIFVAKYAANGECLWVQTGKGMLPADHEISNRHVPFTMPQLVLAPDGKVILRANGATGFDRKPRPYTFEAGSTQGIGGFLVQFDGDGKVLLTLEPSNLGSFGGIQVAPGPDGTFFVAGPAAETNLHFFRKYSSVGELLWTKHAVVRSGSAIVTSLIADPSGGIVASGDLKRSGYAFEQGPPSEITFGTRSITSGASTEMFVVKYSESGELQWVIQSKGLDPWENFVDYQTESYVSAIRGFVLVAPSAAIHVIGTLSGNVQLGDLILEGGPINSGHPGVFAARLVEPQVALPSLSISADPDAVRIRWPATASNFILEETTSLGPTVWNKVTYTAQQIGSAFEAVAPKSATAQFFRLRKP